MQESYRALVRSRTRLLAACDALSADTGSVPDPVLDAARAVLEAVLDDQETYLHAAAHDLRNPLTAIRGQAQLLRRRVRRDAGETDLARIDDGLAAIEAMATRAAELVDDLLDRKRPDDAPEPDPPAPPRTERRPDRVPGQRSPLGGDDVGSRCRYLAPSGVAHQRVDAVAGCWMSLALVRGRDSGGGGTVEHRVRQWGAAGFVHHREKFGNIERLEYDTSVQVV